jgi:hypothetical protein
LSNNLAYKPRESPIGITFAQSDYAAVYLKEHFAFVLTHIKEFVAAVNTGNDNSGTWSRHPKTFGGHVDDMTKDVGHAYIVASFEI